MRISLFALLFALGTTGASADDLYNKCMDAADGTNPGFAKCGGDRVARADTELNKVWNELYSGSQDRSKKDLLAEQRLWNVYKKKSCSFFGSGDWGREGQVIQFPACRAEVIEMRTNQLKTYISPNG